MSKLEILGEVQGIAVAAASLGKEWNRYEPALHLRQILACFSHYVL